VHCSSWTVLHAQLVAEVVKALPAAADSTPVCVLATGRHFEHKMSSLTILLDDGFICNVISVLEQVCEHCSNLK